MSKARKLGWHGFVDSTQSLREVFLDFVKLRIIPSVPTISRSYTSTNTTSPSMEGYSEAWLEVGAQIYTKVIHH